MASQNHIDLTKNGNGGKILVFISENIPSKLIELQMRIEGFFDELSLQRKKIGSYIAPIILNFSRYHFIQTS